MPGQKESFKETFIELLKPVYNELLRYCKSMYKNGCYDDAEDLFQNTLIKGYQKIESLDDETKFKSWIFTIATREYISMYRSGFWKRFLPLGDEHNNRFVSDVYDRSDSDHDKIILHYALSRLSYKERSAILLFEIGNFSIRDIRDIQNERSESAVKSRLSRVREKLKKIILESGGENIVNINPKKGDLEDETLNILSGIKRKGDEPNGQVLG
jgi:RNA polymerase sigma-70 factor (ECF subfamily)